MIPISQTISLFLKTISGKPYNRLSANILFRDICRELEDDQDISIVSDLRDVGTEFREAAINAIKKRKTRTGKEFRIINDFFKYLEEHYQLIIAPIGPQLDTLERKLWVYNLRLDDPSLTMEQLSDLLLVPQSTIKDDLGGLRDGIHVADQHLTLGCGLLPIFLALNEREVKNVLENIDPHIAESILLQQTEKRREEILENLDPVKADALRALLENRENPETEPAEKEEPKS